MFREEPQKKEIKKFEVGEFAIKSGQKHIKDKPYICPVCGKLNWKEGPCALCGNAEHFCYVTLDELTIRGQCALEGFIYFVEEEWRKKYVYPSEYFDEAKHREYMEREGEKEKESDLYYHTPVYKPDGSLDYDATINTGGNGLEPKIVEPVYKPKCPTCGSTRIQKISGLERVGSVAVFGIFSKKINKTFKCSNCGYTW